LPDQPGSSPAKQFQAFEGYPEKGEMSNAERVRLLDLAQRLAAILDQVPTSPESTAMPPKRFTGMRLPELRVTPTL